MERRTFPGGEAIVVEGAETFDAYLIESGQVVVSRGEQRLRTLGPGEMFGEMALVDDKPRSATATALTDVTVAVIERDEFEVMWRTSPEALIPLVRVLCDRVRALNALVDELRDHSADTRETVAAHQVPGYMSPAGATRVTLEGLTAAARASLGARPRTLERFPFRIGRVTVPGDPLSANDLSVSDAPPFHVSRSHCAITLVGERVYVVDRGSRLGTLVGGTDVSSATGRTRAELRPGTTPIALGGAHSKVKFAVTVGR
jgi:CRP-like cAMP-binding protein